MTPLCFHNQPYKWKKKHPQVHSCAVCYNRPIDFCNAPDSHRSVYLPAWEWKIHVTGQQTFKAWVADKEAGTTEHRDKLKVVSPCRMGSWSKAHPFYSNDCELFERTVGNCSLFTYFIY